MIQMFKLAEDNKITINIFKWKWYDWKMQYQKQYFWWTYRRVRWIFRLVNLKISQWKWPKLKCKGENKFKLLKQMKPVGLWQMVYNICNLNYIPVEFLHFLWSSIMSEDRLWYAHLISRITSLNVIKKN